MLSVILILEAKENNTQKIKTERKKNNMDKNTLSHYGWIVISLIVSLIMITSATDLSMYEKNKVQQFTNDLIISAFEEEL